MALPVDQDPPYPVGVLAMAKAADPATTGSQFFIVYEDSEILPQYTVVGAVTQGMDIVEQVAAGGASDAAGEPVLDGTPNTELVIETLRVSDPA